MLACIADALALINYTCGGYCVVHNLAAKKAKVTSKNLTVVRTHIYIYLCGVLY